MAAGSESYRREPRPAVVVRLAGLLWRSTRDTRRGAKTGGTVGDTSRRRLQARRADAYGRLLYFRLDDEHDLSSCCASLDGAVGSGGLVEREGAVQDRAQISALEVA